MATNRTKEIAAKAALLPDDLQSEALQFVESLLARQTNGASVKTADVDSAPPVERRRLFGSLEHLHIKLTDEDIREARREMWGEYMGEDGR